MRLFWIIHNNTSNTGRVIVEGLKKVNPTIELLSSREDLIWLRPFDESLISRWGNKPLGHFPDSDKFIPELASSHFWERLEEATTHDVIIMTINAGANHNAIQAWKIIEKKNLFNRTIILDEDESCRKGLMEYKEYYIKSKIILANLGERVRDIWGNIRNHVYFFCFNGLEDRYFPTEHVNKDISVFFKSRVEGWLTPRIPFRDKLVEMKNKGLIKDSCVMPIFRESEGDQYFKLVSGDRHHPEYYKFLNRSKMAVYLNGYNPIGYQFWENCANKCLTLHQTPWKSAYYNGGDNNYSSFHWEAYDPPFIPNKDFFYFETPEDLESVILRLEENPEVIEEAAESCYNKALNFSSTKLAERFLKLINLYMVNV